MTFYNIIILFSSISFYLAIRFDKKNDAAKFIFMFLFLMVPSFIGGMRNENIGSDMQGYGSLDFYEARRYSLSVYLSDVTTPEYAYLILNWICAKISPSINFFLFIAELIKISCIGYFAWQLRKEINATLFVIMYLLPSYWYGFSLMRQSLAMSVCLVAIYHMYRRNYIWAAISFFIAYQFHNSAAFALILSLIFVFKGNKKRLFVVILGSFAMVALWQVAIIFMASSGFFRSDLNNYIDSGVASDKTNIVLAIVSILLSIAIVRIKKNPETKNWNSILICMSILYLAFLLMSRYIETAFRVSFYARIFVFTAICFLAKNLTKGKYNRLIFLLYLSLLIASNYISATHGAADTIPYKSEILGVY